MAKRILIYTTAYLPLIGGAEIAVKEITDRLDGFSFDLITSRLDRNLPKEEAIGRIKIHRLGWGTPLDKLWLAWRGGRYGLKLHQKNHYDVVWGVMASFGGLAALRFKELVSEVKFLLTLQEGDDLKEIKTKMMPLWWRFKKIFTRADCLQVISNYLADWAKRMGARAPIVVIPNGVDFNKFGFIERQKNKVIITTSRLVKKNGVDSLIKALLFLPADYRLQILGIGPEESRLRSLVTKFKLTERVEFKGLVPQENLAAHLHQAEIFARPALSEGLGNSYLEAMACGLPIIGTSVGGIPDFLSDAQTGWFCQPNNPFDLAEKIKLVTSADNQSQVDQVVSQARHLVEEKYDWVKIAERMKQLLANL